MNIPKKIQKDIEEAIRFRAKAKALEEEAKLYSDRAKRTLLPIMTAHDIKDYALEGVGKVSVLTNRGSSINAGKLEEVLLLYGCSPDEVTSLVEEASVSWATEYIGFKSWTS